MEDETYAPEWIVNSDYCTSPNEGYEQRIREFCKKSMKDICAEITEKKK